MPTQAQRDFTKAVIKRLAKIVCPRCRAGEEITFDSEGGHCHGIDPANGCGLELCNAAAVWTSIEDQGMYHEREGQALDAFIENLQVEVTDGPGRDYEVLHCRDALHGAWATVNRLANSSHTEWDDSLDLVGAAKTISGVRDWLDEVSDEMHLYLRNPPKAT